MRMSFGETIFLFVLALVIFGPKKLPEIARQVGKYLNEFKRASNEFKSQIEQEIAHLEVENNKQTILPPSTPVPGAESRTAGAETYASKELAASSEAPAAEAPASLAATAEESASNGNHGAEPPVATEAVPSQTSSEAIPSESVPSEEVTSSTSQESHA